MKATRSMPVFHPGDVFMYQDTATSQWSFLQVVEARPNATPIRVNQFGMDSPQQFDPTRVFAWCGPIPEPTGMMRTVATRGDIGDEGDVHQL